MIDFHFITEHFSAFFGGGQDRALFSSTDGLIMTLQLSFVSLFIGLVLALPMALLKVSKVRALSWPITFFTYIFRGTPMLVQLFMIYYGFSQFDMVRDSWLWDYLQNAYVCAIIAFALNTAAYTTEIIAGQIRTMPSGEIEAAKAMGMNTAQVMRRIVLPSALRRALPMYSNEVIMIIHGTSIAGLITLADLTGVARHLYSETYHVFEPFLSAAAIYLVLTLSVVWLFKRAERRWLAHLAPRHH